IRGFDNLPVLSWLILRGRCRDCGTTISRRYPSIEALVACVVLAVVASDAFGSGTGQDWLKAACHVLLMCTLICATLMELDGHVPPWRLYLPTLILSAVAVFLWPLLDELPEAAGANTESMMRIVDAALSTLIGAGVGLLMSPIARRLQPNFVKRGALAWPLA